MNSEELQQALLLHGSQYVYNNFLLNEDVYLLREKFADKALEAYHNLKIAVSNELQVPLKNVAIVGSAKVGYSLTPGNNFSAFHAESDLDLVVVSPKLFNELWENYLSFVNSFSGCTYAPIAKNIFKHFVAINVEKITGEELRFFADWVTRVGVLKRKLQLDFKMPVEINYRVYDTWEYVERYHVAGLNELMVK